MSDKAWATRLETLKGQRPYQWFEADTDARIKWTLVVHGTDSGLIFLIT